MKRVLAIDGGGIRGILPAQILADLENELARKFPEKPNLWQHFDLVSGTSTGGIIALAISVGIKASDILRLYIENGSQIFGKPNNILCQLIHSKYSNRQLLALLKERFYDENFKRDLVMSDCLTNVCIPVYDMFLGKPTIIKNPYMNTFIRDKSVPIYTAAMSTSAAPTYFNAYSGNYYDDTNKVSFNNKVDGGIFANNPSLIAYNESVNGLGFKVEELGILSIGTGFIDHSFNSATSAWGVWFWMNPRKRRIIDTLLHAQSMHVDGIMQIICQGVDKQNNPRFIFERINPNLTGSLAINLDENRPEYLERFQEFCRSISAEKKSHIIHRLFP